MGQKIHPVGLRVGVIRGFDSHWYCSKKGYGPALLQDHKIRTYIKDGVGLGNVSRVEIERAANRVKVTIFTARPGAIIGRGGKGIDVLTEFLNRMVRREDSTIVVQVYVIEVRQPELDAQLVAENICQQIEKRISHRRAMRQAMTRCVRMNCRGIKIQVSGRLGGSEIARTESDKTGKIPLHTIRADIDYGMATAHTVYGSIGCKVWIYKGEVFPEQNRREMEPDPTVHRNRRVRINAATAIAFESFVTETPTPTTVYDESSPQAIPWIPESLLWEASPRHGSSFPTGRESAAIDERENNTFVGRHSRIEERELNVYLTSERDRPLEVGDVLKLRVNFGKEELNVKLGEAEEALGKLLPETQAEGVRFAVFASSFSIQNGMHEIPLDESLDSDLVEFSLQARSPGKQEIHVLASKLPTMTLIEHSILTVEISNSSVLAGRGAL